MSVPLVDLEDIEAALGRALSDEEAAGAVFADKLSESLQASR